MHIRLNKAKLRTCGAEMWTLLNQEWGCKTVVTGDSFLCRVRQLEIHVRATVGNSGGYRREPICNCYLMATLRVTLRRKFINNNVVVLHDVSSPYTSSHVLLNTQSALIGQLTYA